MSKELKGSRRSPPGSRCPTENLPSAIRWERTRARLFSELGQRDQASYASGLAVYYERRAMDECSGPGPT